MAPKKTKDIIDDDTYWRVCIEEASLNDDNWAVKVILIEAAGNDHDHIYLNKFENCAAGERRFVVKNICKTETVFMINQLGGEKKIKDESLRVFEEGQTYLKEKKDVPSEIMALIIKHLILKMKEEYIFIQRQRLEVREGMKQESATMINKAEVKGTVSVKAEPQELQPAPVKGKEQDLPNPIDIDENKKYSTPLRVRGEEWRDKTYIDDYPNDGPNLYVAVTGFLDPNLAEELIKVGVPLVGIVQIRINSTDTSIPSGLLRHTKRGQSQTDMIAEKSLKFWEQLQQLRINKISSDFFKNTVFVVFTPPYWDTECLSSCDEKIYDEICFLMYDIQDLTRQHINYLDNMNVMKIPEENVVDSLQEIYQTKIGSIPLESINMYFILDAILQTVSQNFDEVIDISSTSNAGFVLTPIHEDISAEHRLLNTNKHITQVFRGLSQIDLKKKKYRVTNGAEYENHTKPLVINYGDFYKINVFHIDNVNLDSIVYSMLIGMPINQLWQSRPQPTEEASSKVNFHLNLILSCFDRSDVETAELYRLLNILACRKLYNNRSSLKKDYKCPLTITEFKKTYLKRSILAEPLTKQLHKNTSFISPSLRSVLLDEKREKSDTPSKDESRKTQFLFDCPDISELISVVEIIKQKPMKHMIDNFQYFEDFTDSIAFQVIYDAFNHYNCIDYKYCEVTDSFIMMFYNSHDNDGITRNEWRSHLSTPICLQDFFDFVLEEHYDWIKNEENVYEKNIILRTQSDCDENKKKKANQLCVEHKELDMELLIEGSLKYEEITNNEIDNFDDSNSQIFIPRKVNTPLSTTDLDSMRSGKKSKSPALTNPKIAYQKSETELKLDLSKKIFSGYDLGDRRVEVFGKDSAYFSKDGTRISTSYILLIPMNLEFINMNIVPGNSCNEIWVHKALGEVNNPGLNTNESFRIMTKNQCSYYIKKKLNMDRPYIDNPISFSTIHSSIPLKNQIPDISDVTTEHNETTCFYSLLVTWPNGLITESVYENNSSKISHIKQHCVSHLSKLEEEKRCISLDGEVIIFKTNSEIEILKPDSTYIKIKKCEKRINNDDIPESVYSATSSDKSKKGKHKPTKPSKSSKRNLIEDETLILPKELKYELFIDEFEVINSNGLKQRWVEDKNIYTENLLIKTATDFCLREVFMKRMDGTSILLNKDGDQVVTFYNNTRIITKYIVDEEEIYPEWTDEEIEYFSILDDKNVNLKTNISQLNHKTETISKTSSLSSIGGKNKGNVKEIGYVSVYLMYTIEHSNFTTITINKYTEKISVDSPNKSSVTVDKDNRYEFTLDEKSSANFDGVYLNIEYKPYPESSAQTNCEVKIGCTENCSLSNLQGNWLQMTDSFDRRVMVNEEGNINIADDLIDETLQKKSDCFEDFTFNEQSESNGMHNIAIQQTKYKESNESKSIKFFILRRDLSCSELVHQDVLEEYRDIYINHPWFSINHYDGFGDHRRTWSLLIPVDLNESERWLMDSNLSSKPKNLKYNDLMEDSGKGFYHWMRPYKRFKPKPIKPDPIIPERQPRAFIFRILEQQWKDSESEHLNGAKELIKAILRYRNRLETDSQTILNIPVNDRGADILMHEKVQGLSHRLYKNLSDRLKKDVQSNAKKAITTKPRISYEASMEEEIEEEIGGKQIIKDAESAEEISPNLERYWRRRAEEYKEEQFYRYLLREGNVPPYFRNVLGGAIWWDVNKATNDAVAKVEKRKVKCVCDDD